MEAGKKLYMSVIFIVTVEKCTESDWHIPWSQSMSSSVREIVLFIGSLLIARRGMLGTVPGSRIRIDVRKTIYEICLICCVLRLSCTPSYRPRPTPLSYIFTLLYHSCFALRALFYCTHLRRFVFAQQ